MMSFFQSVADILAALWAAVTNLFQDIGTLLSVVAQAIELPEIILGWGLVPSVVSLSCGFCVFVAFIKLVVGRDNG